MKHAHQAPSPFRPGLLLLLGCILHLALPQALQASAGELQRAEHLIDTGQPEQAIQILDRLLRQDRRNAQALLLRSTASFQLDELEAGKRDLHQALEIDPGLRQGWLNRAAVELSEERYPAALESLERARALDPGAPDNDLNIGAVLLLLGRLDQASQSFQTYLSRHLGDARAFYLVSVNYAGSGYAGLALQHLTQAVAIDERRRMQARTDPSFSGLFDHPRFQDLMATDTFRPVAGSYQAQRTYERPYASGQGPLLQAVLDALMALNEPFDPRVEVTSEWALVWAEMRIKIADAPGGGVVQLTAAPDHVSIEQWQVRSKRLLDSILVHLHRQRR